MIDCHDVGSTPRPAQHIGIKGMRYFCRKVPWPKLWMIHSGDVVHLDHHQLLIDVNQLV
jgi:hypothetical protein